MKKIFFLSSILLLGLIGCQDVNDKFDWLDDAVKPVNVINDSITISESDIATIVSATNKLADGADKTYGAALGKNKVFSDAAPAEVLIPYLLPSLYFSPDPKSSVFASYQFKNEMDDLLAGLITSNDNPAYVLGNEDYENVWGKPYATALTPVKSPAKELPKLLKNKFADAENGTYKVIEYAYSTEEPVSSTAIGKIFEEQDFDDLGLAANDNVAISGWLNVDLEGSRFWQMKSYNNNFYAQASSYNSKSKNDTWLIMQAVDLKDATNPHLVFDLKVGNWNSSCLSILVSTDFDGNQANIESATWDNISTEFTIPTVPTSGYAADFSSAGFGSLIPYNGKKVYIAFRYIGDDISTTKATTTYQIDNIQVVEAIPGIEVESKETVYTAYEKTNDAWKPVSNVIVLQPSDYTSVGANGGYFSQATAQANISAVLVDNYKPSIAGAEKVVVYKTNATNFYADRLTYSYDNGWTINSLVETKSSQFILNDKREWVFDPTFVITMTTEDYQLVVDYVMTHQALTNSALINSSKDSEFYYGFNAYRKNITYRLKDRVYDPAYPETGTEEEQLAFCEERTIEGFNVFLAAKYPDAKPDVNGIEQKAVITAVIYYGPAGTDIETFEFEFQCVGDKEWKLLSKEKI